MKEVMKDLTLAPFDKTKFKQSVNKYLVSLYGQSADTDSAYFYYLAICRALSEFTVVNLLATEAKKNHTNCKSINYFSLEFLIGRLTGNNLLNLGIYNDVKDAIDEMGINFADILEQERDPALGNGGLGRLAACYMDSLATQKYPAVGYGLHYHYGLFKQTIVDCQQVESPDKWFDIAGYPWQILRSELSQQIGLMGRVEIYQNELGDTCRRWLPSVLLKGVAWDIPVIGYQNDYALPLRLWECQANEPFNFEQFNKGDFFWAHSEEMIAANVTEILYPNDQHDKGKMLRLTQQYFLCACSLGDMLTRHLALGRNIERLAEFETVQLNDTHPAIAIPELMRLLLDKYQLGWELSWQITTQLFAYTNHTLLPEALECWSEGLIRRLLPRHAEIIAEINRRFLILVEEKWPNNEQIKQKLSIISFDKTPMVRMANLCVVTAYAVNGVAKLHSELVKKDLFPEFNALFPNRLCNITNGVTPRRWLELCNPKLSELISSKIGQGWQTELHQLSKLSAYADDPQFQADFQQVKLENKQRLADWVFINMGITVDVHAIFDVHIKRLHEYKRQHLNLLHILSLYYRLLNDDNFDISPRVFIFAAKAAPAYAFAKEIIFAINKIADKINNDPRLNEKLKIIFIPDYCVSLAEIIIPAADVSEQISTAGKEASGTGNMKLALNGAVTVGTLDGANVEIKEEVGEENIYIFGLTVSQVMQIWQEGYQPKSYYEKNSLLKNVLLLLEGNEFTPNAPGRLAGISHNLLNNGDPYLVLADFASYVDAQSQIDIDYKNKTAWVKKSILNTALMGKFSSDRSINDYATQIWKVSSIHE